MSKMDDMRAMREARYAQSAARAAKPAATPKRSQRSTPDPAKAPLPAADLEIPESPEERLCGHRAISGRTCTREHGHEAKSHRYS
ncbi:MAG: hypothetical protein WKF79_11095 [Nocardioides sp.]